MTKKYFDHKIVEKQIITNRVQLIYYPKAIKFV